MNRRTPTQIAADREARAAKLQEQADALRLKAACQTDKPLALAVKLRNMIDDEDPLLEALDTFIADRNPSQPTG
jgi:hypothetical protein